MEIEKKMRSSDSASTRQTVTMVVGPPLTQPTFATANGISNLLPHILPILKIIAEICRDIEITHGLD